MDPSAEHGWKMNKLSLGPLEVTGMDMDLDEGDLVRGPPPPPPLPSSGQHSPKKMIIE